MRPPQVQQLQVMSVASQRLVAKQCLDVLFLQPCPLHVEKDQLLAGPGVALPHTLKQCPTLGVPRCS